MVAVATAGVKKPAVAGFREMGGVLLTENLSYPCLQCLKSDLVGHLFREIVAGDSISGDIPVSLQHLQGMQESPVFQVSRIVLGYLVFPNQQDDEKRHLAFSGHVPVQRDAGEKLNFKNSALNFYGQFHAMGKNRPRPREAMVYATQSTHKLLAGISQASQVLVQDSQQVKLDKHLFNEAYLMHTSTSPQYSIIASCDVAAAMMEPPGGTALVEESIRESLDFRRAMRKVDEDYGADWWFKVWGPDFLRAEEGSAPTAQDWMLHANEDWHGFGAIAEGFNMLDPIKSTIITPGLDMEGRFAATGIPASVVTKFLVEHGVVVEKTGLYSFFIMFTIGITKGRWNTLLTALQQFKDDYDKNAPLWRILPEFCAKYPMYERMGLRDLCQSIHQAYADADIARLTTDMYLSNLQPAMTPTDAYAHIAQRRTERVGIDELEGRITTSLLTPYPPGIPLLIPGERFNKKIVDYLKFTRAFNAKFPGFATDVHGLVHEVDEESGKGHYYVDCVKQ